MVPWLIPVITSAVLGLLGLWYMKRRDVVAADRGVLDSIWSDLAEYHRRIKAAQGAAQGTRPNVRDLASDLHDAWYALEVGASHVGKLSRLRYDGLRALADRVRDACRTTTNDRALLKTLADGVATTSPTRLLDTIPWQGLNTDALVYWALAGIYRREGPLAPRRRAWWRLPARREATDWQIAAPIRHWVKGHRYRSADELVTSIDQVREMIRTRLEFADLSATEVNELAYRVLHSDNGDGGE